MRASCRAVPEPHRLPDGGDDRDAVPAGRGLAHRRHLGLHGASAAGAQGETAGLGVHQREDRPHRRARSPIWCSVSPICRPTSRRSSIRHGIEVHVFNQRSVADILRVIRTLGGMIGCEAKAAALAERARGGPRVDPRVRRRGCRAGRASTSRNGTSRRSPAIRWVSELIGIAGGDDVFPELAQQALGRDRIIADPLEIAAARARSDLRLVVRQEVQPALRGCASRVGRGAGGARRRAARGQVVDHPAARTSGADRWRARAASRDCGVGGGAGLNDHPSPVSRRSASWYFSLVRRMTSAGRRGAGGRLSQSSVSR